VNQIAGASMGSVKICNRGLSLPSAAWVLAGMLLSACSVSSSAIDDSGPAPTLSGRFSNIFASAEAKPQMTAQAAPTGPAFNDEDCPSVEVRTGAGTLAIAANTSGPATANDLRYQLTFIQLARQCFLMGSTLRMKAGVQGRVVVGPAGAPDQVEVPIRFAVVREGVEPKTITTKLKKLTIALPPGTANTEFTDIEDDLSFPLPSRAELDSYVLYIGYDGSATTERKPAPKAAKKGPPPKRTN
jgi:hypothetical protein